MVTWGWGSAWGLSVYGDEGSWGDRNVLKLDFGDNPTTQLTCLQPFTVPFKWVNFMICKSYLKKAEEKKTFVLITFEKHCITW